MHAAIWVNGQVQQLGSLGGSVTVATDINSSGQVVGYGTTASGATHAFLWSNGTMMDLGTLGGTRSEAYGINDLGQIVGYSYLADPNPSDSIFESYYKRGVLWENGKAKDLEAGEYNRMDTRAQSINNKSQIAGNTEWPGGSKQYAVFWSQIDGRLVRGTDRLGSFAQDLNNLGRVAGYTKEAYTGVPLASTWSGDQHSYLPTPTLLNQPPSSARDQRRGMTLRGTTGPGTARRALIRPAVPPHGARRARPPA